MSGAFSRPSGAAAPSNLRSRKIVANDRRIGTLSDRVTNLRISEEHGVFDWIIYKSQNNHVFLQKKSRNGGGKLYRMQKCSSQVRYTVVLLCACMVNDLCTSRVMHLPVNAVKHPRLHPRYPPVHEGGKTVILDCWSTQSNCPRCVCGGGRGFLKH